VVFIEEQAVPEHIETDGLDPLCVHFLAVASGTDLGAARLRFVNGQVAKAERVAVFARCRGRGIGRLLMCALEEAAWTAGANKVKLGAQMSAVPFYLRLGYSAVGPEFNEAGIPHRMMFKARPD
jgi:predicted GNAT family N-acyltransferase